MKRRVTLMMLMLSSFLLSAASARAEVRFKIPFDFSVGNVSLPAGSYTVSRLGSVPTHLKLRSNDLNEDAIEQINSVELNPGEVSDATKLVFHRYGNQYFLTQFWTLGSRTGFEFRRSRAEKQMGRKVAKPGTEILSASK